MPTTQQGWTVRLDAVSMTPLEHITGRVLSGDVHTIFDFLCRRYEALVEPIIKGHSWGWAPRPVRGYTDVWSEHAAGVAIDLNAPAHMIGLSGTFTPDQVRGIRQLLAECGGVVIWGGDWKHRPDEMHFEIVNNPSKVKWLAGLIRGEKAEKADQVKATPKIATRQTASITEWLTQQGRDASFSARAKLAKQYGITGYRGTASQNLQLLALLRDAGGTVKTHKIVAGDTLWGLSKTYGVDLSTLRSLNPGVDPDNLRVGQTITVKGA